MLVPEEYSSDRERRLDEAIAEYYQLAEKGRAPSPDLFRARHADLADDLAAFFADKAAFDRCVGVPPVSEQSTSTPGSSKPPSGEHPQLIPPERVPPLQEPLSPVDVETALNLDNTSLGGPKTADDRRIFGDYELQEEIAQDGMGVVWRARQISLNRPVAIRSIPADRFASRSDVLRFRTEVETAAALDHPNILPIYEIGEHDGQHFVSRKLIHGLNFGESIPILAKDPRRAVRLLVLVARAVHHAHQHGLVHRNLEPANILLDKQDRPYITDFGLPHPQLGIPHPPTPSPTRGEGEPDGERGEPERSGSPLSPRGVRGAGGVRGASFGPEYRPPEQFEVGKHLTTAVDVYSLGAILYECLTGKPPFRGDSPSETVSQVLEKEPGSPRTANPTVDPDLETICLKCLEKSPARRYETASALADDLERWSRNVPILARPSSNQERAVKWARRRPILVGLAAILFLVAGAGVAGLFNQWRQAEAGRDREALRADEEKNALQQARQALHEESRRADAEGKANNDKRQTLEELERRLYLQQIALAHQAWQAADIPRMKELLNLCPPNHRAWEWGFLRRLGHGDLGTLPLGTTAEQAAFSPDGKLLAIACYGKGPEVHLLDPLSGNELRRISLTKGFIDRIAFAPDGKHLAVGVGFLDKTSGSVDFFLDLLDRGEQSSGQVFLYDPHTAKFERNLGEGTVTSRALSFSPDSKWLAVGGQDKLVRLYDITTGNLVRTLKGHHQEVLGLSFHPLRNHLASLTRNELKVWDLTTGREAFLPEARNVGGSSLDFSRDGRFLAVADAGRLVKVLEASNGRLLQAMPGHTDTITCVAFHPDGESLASSARDRTVRTWDHHQGRAVTALRGHTGPITGVAFSPDGRMLASCARSDAGKSRQGEVKLWDATRNDQEALPLRSQGTSHEEGVFHPDGERFTATTVRGELKTWNVRTGEQLSSQELGGLLRGRAFSPDNRWLAAAVFDSSNRNVSQLAVKEGVLGEGTLAQRALPEGKLHYIRLYDASTGRPGQALESPEVNPLGLAFSRDGRKLAVCSGRGAKVWNPSTGKKLFTVTGHDSLTMRLSLSPDGRWLITGNDPSIPWSVTGKNSAATLKLWDLSTGKEIWSLTPENGSTPLVAISPNSKWIVTPGEEGLVSLWNSRTGKTEYSLPRQRRRQLLATFSHDSKTLATAGSDSVVHLHEVLSGKLLHSLSGHTRALASLEFSPDGRRLVSASVLGDPGKPVSQSGEMKVWDVASGREVLALDGRGKVQFSPDGKRIASFGPRIHDATEPTSDETGKRRLAWTNSKRGWHELRADETETARHTGPLIFHLTELIQMQPKSAPLHGRRGDAYAMRGEHAKAIDDFTLAIQHGAEKGPSWYGQRGLAFAHLRQFDKAILDLSQSLSRGESLTVPVLIARGQSHLGQSQPDKAIIDFSKAIEKQPNQRAAWSGRGEALAVQGKWKESDQDFSRAIDLDPFFLDDQERRLVVLLAAGRFDESRKALAKMIESFGQGEETDLSLDLVLACVRIPKAVDSATLLRLAFRGAKTTGEDAVRRFYPGAVFCRVGLYESALPHLLAAEKARPAASSVDAFFLALTYQGLGRKEDARSAFKRGVAINEEEERKKTLNWRQRIVRQVLRQEVAALLK